MRRVVVLLLIAVTALSCGSDPERPDAEEWRGRWEAALAAVPDRATVEGPGRDAACEEALGRLRELGPTLSPTPEATADDAVEAWVELADEVFFECPPRSGEVSGFDEGYAELERFRQEVEDGLR